MLRLVCPSALVGKAASDRTVHDDVTSPSQTSRMFGRGSKVVPFLAMPPPPPWGGGLVVNRVGPVMSDSLPVVRASTPAIGRAVIAPAFATLVLTVARSRCPAAKSGRARRVNPPSVLGRSTP